MNFYLWFTMFNKVPIFHFQNQSDLINCNSLFGCNRIYVCKSIICRNMNLKIMVEVDAVRRFRCYGQVIWTRQEKSYLCKSTLRK